jgi:parallel beta-helix repeat protein
MPILYAHESKNTAPSAPANGNTRVYGDNGDNKLKVRKSDVSVVDLGGGGEGGGEGGTPLDNDLQGHGWLVWYEGTDGLYHAKNGFTGAEDHITPHANPSVIVNSVITAAKSGDASAPVDILLAKGSYGHIWQSGLSRDENVVGNITIRGMGMGLTRIKIDQAIGSSAAISLRGHVDSELAASPLTANATRGSDTITVSSGNAANYSPGNYILIRSPNGSWMGSAGHMPLEIKKVVSISGGTITVNGMLHDNYNTADAAEIKRVLFLKNIRLADLTIERNTGLSATQKWFTPQYIDNLTVERVMFDSPTRRFQGCCDIRSCINSRITNCYAVMQPEVEFNEQYGFETDGCCENVIFENCQSYGRFRHGFAICVQGNETDSTQGPNRNILVTNCQGGGGNNIAVFDTHEGGENITFHNCKAFTSKNRGFTIRSYKNKIIDCESIDCASEGIALSGGAGDTQIINFHADNCLDGINATSGRYATDTNLIIANSHIENCTRNGINLEAQADHTHISNCQIHNNSGGQGIRVVSSNYVKIIGNTIRNNSNWGITFTSGDCQKNTVAFNTITGNSSGTIQNGGQTGNQETGNITT